MTIEFLTDGTQKRLILIFAGWSTEVGYYRDCVIKGWDTAVISDYGDLTPPYIPSHYKTVFIFAYSLGVFAASICDVMATARIAISGTCIPISDEFGIPENVYYGTADNLNQRNLTKFHRRMAGDRETFDRISPHLPSNPDIESLRDELKAIANKATDFNGNAKWNRAYISSRDAIFPPESQHHFWESHSNAEIIDIDSPHAVNIAKIIRSVIPDTQSVGKSFFKSIDSYRDHAEVQRDISRRIADILRHNLTPAAPLQKILEIGAGCGLLTEAWSAIINPESATFVDLYEPPHFCVVQKENYVCADAEVWIDETEEKYDVIVSASTMQWFADPIGFSHKIKGHLRPGGIAVLSTFVKGNLSELDPLRPSPILYRTEEEYRRDLPQGASVETWSKTLSFASRKELLMHLRLTGVSMASDTRTNPLPLTSYPLSLTYRPLVITIIAD